MSADNVLRIANCSGFWGDRFSAAREMVRGGPIDVLTGDYLAELTMAILHKTRLKNPSAGYVPTFLKQLEEILGECLDRKIRIVVNAGGLNPGGLAEAIHELAAKLGLRARVAHITGDDMLPRIADLQAAGEHFVHMERNVPLRENQLPVVTANAYLGGAGIRFALEQGAEIVICPRVTDASLVVGPAAWYFSWATDAWDQLAGAVAAGHIIECGTQTTGGNYSFFDEVPSWHNVGFPVAEIAEDGSCVITKHAGTGGLVSVGTVTAQLLYEIDSPRYRNPDVTARFDTVQITQQGENRVRISGARGEPAPDKTKVCINLFGGYKNSMQLLIGGLYIEKKAALFEEMLFDALGGKEQFARTQVILQRMDKPNPPHNEDALAYLRVTVAAADKELVGRSFSSTVVEQILATAPGFTSRTPPGEAAPYLVLWPALIDNRWVEQTVHFEGQAVRMPVQITLAEESPIATEPTAPVDVSVPTVAVPLGRLFGTRSGDKGGNANLGVWARSSEAYLFLRNFLTVERLKELCGDFAEFAIERYEFPNVWAVNFVIHGILGEGVAASMRTDPQAKTLGEYVRAKIVDVPVALVK